MSHLSKWLYRLLYLKVKRTSEKTKSNRVDYIRCLGERVLAMCHGLSAYMPILLLFISYLSLRIGDVFSPIQVQWGCGSLALHLRFCLSICNVYLYSISIIEEVGMDWWVICSMTPGSSWGGGVWLLPIMWSRLLLFLTNSFLIKGKVQ